RGQTKSSLRRSVPHFNSLRLRGSDSGVYLSDRNRKSLAGEASVPWKSVPAILRSRRCCARERDVTRIADTMRARPRRGREMLENDGNRGVTREGVSPGQRTFILVAGPPGRVS